MVWVPLWAAAAAAAASACSLLASLACLSCSSPWAKLQPSPNWHLPPRAYVRHITVRYLCTYGVDIFFIDSTACELNVSSDVPPPPATLVTLPRPVSPFFNRVEFDAATADCLVVVLCKLDCFSRVSLAPGPPLARGAFITSDPAAERRGGSSLLARILREWLLAPAKVGGDARRSLVVMRTMPAALRPPWANLSVDTAAETLFAGGSMITCSGLFALCRRWSELARVRLMLLKCLVVTRGSPLIVSISVPWVWQEMSRTSCGCKLSCELSVDGDVLAVELLQFCTLRSVCLET